MGKHKEPLDLIAKNYQEQAYLYKSEEYQEYNCKNIDMKTEAKSLDIH